MKTFDCKCGRTMRQTNWIPPIPLDPFLRQYKCPATKKCGRIEYLVDDEKYLKKNRLNQGRISLRQ